MAWLNRLVNQQRLFRRLVLIWAVWLVTHVVLTVTEPSVLTKITSPGATVVVAVIGILATVISFYQWHRQQDDRNS